MAIWQAVLFLADKLQIAYYLQANTSLKGKSMDQNKNQKRLVMIGIRRKGEKGFKKSFDRLFNADQDSFKPVTSEINPGQVSNSSEILRIVSN